MESVFYWTAVISTVLFVLKLISTLTIGDFHFDVGHMHHMQSDTDDSFFAISIQAFLAFSMLFGWTGLAMVNDYKEAAIPSMLLAVGGGLIGVWINKLVFGWFTSFNTPSIKEEPLPEVGTRGVVYTRVSEQNAGLVYTSFRSSRRYYSAKALTGAIESFKIVEITAVNGDLLTVKEI